MKYIITLLCDKAIAVSHLHGDRYLQLLLEKSRNHCVLHSEI